MANSSGKENQVTQTGLYWPGKRTEVDRIVLPFQTVETINESKADRDELSLFRQRGESAPGWRNKLIWGDNKYIMASLLSEFAGKINLIYIDPPFATGADFSINIKLGDLEWTKEASVIEEKAYRDTWGKGLDSYLQMIYDRLVLMRELLEKTGVLVVHLDDHVGHYVKVILDEVFGPARFQNEIIWRRGAGHSDAKRFGRNHDILLVYSISEVFFFTPVWPDSNAEEQEKLERAYPLIDKNGRRYCEDNMAAAGSGPEKRFGDKYIAPPRGQHWRFSQENIDKLWEEGRIIFNKQGTPRVIKYADETSRMPLQDIWTDCIRHISTVTGFPTEKPEKMMNRIIQAFSPPGAFIADFFCGSGTTGAVAEKLSRRWIMSDLSKFAIHTTRKRLLDIQSCKPFEVLNLGKYQKTKLKENGIVRYIDFILKLYRAEPLSGYTMIHGRKAGRMVHIGDVDSIVTEREIRETVKECASAEIKAVDILGWDFEMGLHDLVDRIGDEYSVKIHLVQIPREALEVKDAERGEIRFFDLNYLEIEHSLKDKNLSIFLKDFVISNPEYLPDEVREKVKKFTDYIDYWAVDFNYKNDTFHNMWQSFRTKKHPSLESKCSHKYEEPGSYQVLVKVVDIFGNDTNKLINLEVS